MDINVYVLPNGKLQIMVDGDGVTFAEAEDRTRQVLALLRAQGIEVDQTSAIEQHRDGGIDHVHIHETHHQHH